MQNISRHVYEFGRFRVDANERRLLCDGKTVALPPKIFDTLLVLVENSGHLMSRDELMRAVWKDTFVEENNLTQYVSTLRKILDDTDEKLIETIPRRGYRFADVVRESNGGGLVVERVTRGQLRIAEEIVEETSFLKHALTSPTRLAVVILLIVATGLGAWIWNGRRQSVNAAATPDQEALDLYNRGRALWQTRDAKDLHEATTLLEQAVNTDPNFALAHAALADAYAFDYRLWNKAEASAREAIRLDPSLGEPHATIGFIRMFWEWKIADAEAGLKEAVRLSPNYATARQWYAFALHATGMAGAAALVEMRKALELEPDSPSINADMCQTLYFLRRFDEAIAQCERTLELDPRSYNANAHLYEIYNAKEMYREAVAAFFSANALISAPSPSGDVEKLRRAYETGGIRAFWQSRIETLPYKIPNHYRIAQHYARLHDADNALSYLQQAFDSRDFQFIVFLTDPVFDELRLDPRFQKLRTQFLQL